MGPKKLNQSHVATDPFSDPLWQFNSFGISATTGRRESNVRSDPPETCVFEPKSRILQE